MAMRDVSKVFGKARCIEPERYIKPLLCQMYECGAYKHVSVVYIYACMHVACAYEVVHMRLHTQTQTHTHTHKWRQSKKFAFSEESNRNRHVLAVSHGDINFRPSLK